jgi:serine phosphatase RsbU (regulator of sigma subunit)
MAVAGVSGNDPDIRILLIEDDAGDAFLVQELLRPEAGVSALPVRWVPDLAGAGAVDPAGVDCVLVDLGLPDGSGLAALEQTIRRFPEAAVVVLSGLHDRGLAVRAVAAGAQNYLIKDEVTGPLLERTVRLAVERRGAERAEVVLAQAALRQDHNDRLVRGLLPRLRVDDPGLTIATRYVPGTRGEVLGGDFLDAVELADGTVRLIIGDVSGHGPDEAAVGVNLRIAWRALTLAGTGAEATIGRLHDLLIHDVAQPELFATATDLTLSPDRRSLSVRHAGHPPPLLIGPDGVVDLDGPRSLMLGIELDDVPPEVRFALPETWTLLMFTDGLIEGMDGPPPHRWGADGLAAHLRTLSPTPPHRLAEDLMAEATARNGGPLADDVALLVVQRGPRPGPTP